MLESKDTERGQILVLVALALVALLIVAGLVLDGGMVFLDRRRMQNASDAASLAGTRELAAAMCDNEAAETADVLVYQAVVEYAEDNGAKDASDIEAVYVQFDGNAVVEFNPRVWVGNSLEGGDGVPAGAVGVAAKVNISRKTHFISLAGIDTSSASARGVSVTGPPLTGGGMRPFGVPVQLVQALDSGDVFSVSFQHNEIVWATGEDQLRGWLNMEHVWNPSPSLEEESKGWPRVTGECSGSSCKKYLDDWMIDGWDGTLYGGDYIHSLPGTTTSKVCLAPEGTLIYVPIYDENGAEECSDIPDPKPDCPKGGGGYVFHIVGFVGVKITECKKAPEKELTMEIVEMIIGEGVPSPNSGFGSDVCSSHTMVVTLIE